MKKVFKIVGVVLGCLVLAIAGFCAYVAVTGLPTYDPPATPKITVAKTPARIQRGEAIAQMLCIKCHADQQNRLTGNEMTDLPSFFGKIYTVNITQDKEAGIGKWTDGELIYYLRTGVRPDGSFAPIMPKFPIMADEDMESIVAWLRSDSFSVQPSRKETPPSEYSFVTKLLAHTVLGAVPYKQELQTIPDSTDEVAFGRYVANGLASCFACHSADFTKQDRATPELSAGFYGGGNEMKDEAGNIIYTANLTFDEQTGIARKYTKEQFIKAVKYCVRPDGSVLSYPMPPHTTLTDYEAGSIYEYLKTIPKIHNDVAAKNKQARLASN